MELTFNQREMETLLYEALTVRGITPAGGNAHESIMIKLDGPNKCKVSITIVVNDLPRLTKNPEMG